MTRKSPNARPARLGAVLLALGVLAGCGALTRQEAQEALDEAQVAAQAEALTAGSIELGTNFTIGMAAQQAAAELQTFVETQLPCASGTLANATLTITYGAYAGSCTYRGQTYSGSHAITVMTNTASQVVVHHVFTDLANQTVRVSGTADVTWDPAALSRHVVHDLTWTRLSDGRMGVGTGDRLQQPLGGSWTTGFTVDGTRTWTGTSGLWELTIEGVAMRWIDPVPEAGTYTLDTPFGKRATLRFTRTSSTVVHVVLTSGTKTFQFDVLAL